MNNNSEELVQLIAQAIYDKKGVNPIALDVQGKSTLTDYIIIAEGNVDRHVVAIGKAIVDAMQEVGEKPIHMEGFSNGDWVVIDFCNIMIHIFGPKLREKYQLEQLWSEGEIVDLQIECKKEGVYG